MNAPNTRGSKSMNTLITVSDIIQQDITEGEKRLRDMQDARSNMNTLIDEIFAKFSNQSDDKGITLTWSTEDSVTEAKSELLKAIMQSKPEKKKIVLDRPLDIDDGEQFCVECGQWTYEGEIDCKCMDYNKALDQWEEVIRELFK